MVMSPTEPGETGREEARDRRLRHRISFLLDTGSIYLFALFLLQLLPILLESKPMQAEWQGQFVEMLERQSLVAFLGFVMVHLAAMFNPKKQPLRQRLRQVRHLATIACIGFLLLIPLQLASSLQVLRAMQARVNDHAAEATRLMQVRESIVNSETSEDLQLNLEGLTEPGLSPEQQARNLSDLRKELIEDNHARQARLNALIQDDAPQFSPLVLMISRVGSAVAWAAAFGAGAVPWGSKKSLLERFHRRSELA
jgi:hypothetical protein